MSKLKSYSELIQLKTYEERVMYLMLDGEIGEQTFGEDRYLNQALYHSKEWESIRSQVILRDNGCDLACEDRKLYGRIIIHHINPLTEEDIANRSMKIFDMDNLITVSIDTHNAIHYGDESLLFMEMTDRSPNDTVLWR